MVDEVEKPNFGKVEATRENRLKKKVHLPVIGQLRDSGSMKLSGQMPLESRADLIPA